MEKNQSSDFLRIHQLESSANVRISLFMPQSGVRVNADNMWSYDFNKTSARMVIASVPKLRCVGDDTIGNSEDKSLVWNFEFGSLGFVF